MSQKELEKTLHESGETPDHTKLTAQLRRWGGIEELLPKFAERGLAEFRQVCKTLGNRVRHKYLQSHIDASFAYNQVQVLWENGRHDGVKKRKKPGGTKLTLRQIFLLRWGRFSYEQTPKRVVPRQNSTLDKNLPNQ